MKLGTVTPSGGSQTSASVLACSGEDGQPVTLVEALARSGSKFDEAPRSMLELIRRFDDLRPVLGRATEMAKSVKGIEASTFAWQPPLANPSKILGCAINNAALNRLASTYPAHPPFFVKLPSSLLGHEQPLVIRPDYGLTHPEGELAVIIGKRAKHLKPEDVADAIFGYTIMNDVTSVLLKSADTYVFPDPGVSPPPPGFEHGAMQLAYHARSKGTDGFGPCGPWIVTKDEVPDPNTLDVKVSMGDELCSSDSIANLRFSVEEVISWLTRYVTLEAGDIVHMGTAARGKYSLRQLDFQTWDGPCTVEISGIGRITNPIVRQDLEGRPVEKQAPPVRNVWPPVMAST